MVESVEQNRPDLNGGLRLASRASVGSACRGDLVQRGKAGLVDGAENRVVRRQLRILVHQEELAAVGAWPGIGHGQRASRIHHRLAQLGIVGLEPVGRGLLFELVARAAGSPPCSTARPSEVFSRWHGVSLKKPCWARLAKLFTVHGDLALSSCRPILPWLVAMLALTFGGSAGAFPARGG